MARISAFVIAAIMAGMDARYHQLPKAELHLHLEGSIEPETLRELAPDLSLDEVRAQYTYQDFAGFLGSFEWVTRHLQRPEHYALITRRLLDRLARENVRYAEIIHSTGVVLWREQDPAAVFEAVRGAVEGSGVEVQWIIDAVRHFGVEHARRVAEFAASRVDDGVVAFGIGGDEARGPARLFQEAFRNARANGLRLTAHAGETTGPESIWEALEIGAERIGHGIRAIDDPVLVQHLRDHDIPIEVCLSSNVATGAVASLREHPVRRLFDAGVPITLNTDDPAMFRTTLTAEYELAARELGFSEQELRGIAANAFRYSFHKAGPEATSRT
jgi:adenosine deaminase/aminodeoxyfutalosine deaminase